jgi:hypothetical protein
VIPPSEANTHGVQRTDRSRRVGRIVQGIDSAPSRGPARWSTRSVPDQRRPGSARPSAAFCGTCNRIRASTMPMGLLSRAGLPGADRRRRACSCGSTTDQRRAGDHDITIEPPCWRMRHLTFESVSPNTALKDLALVTPRASYAYGTITRPARPRGPGRNASSLSAARPGGLRRRVHASAVSAACSGRRDGRERGRPAGARLSPAVAT